MREAIVLAGGFGTRLRSIVSDVPKPMAPVKGRPFLDYLFVMLIDAGFQHVVLSTGYKHEVIYGHYQNRFLTLNISYAQEQEPLGTGGGVLNALQLCTGDDVAVLNGDTLFEADFDKLYSQHRCNNSMLSVVLRQVSDTSRYGSVGIDADGRIISFAEKSSAQGAGLVNGGIYLLKNSLLQPFAVGQKFSFEVDVMQKMYKDKLFLGIPDDGFFIDIGIPDDYRRAQCEFPDLNL